MDVSTAWVICWVANSETKIFLTITPNNPTSDTTCGKVDRDWSSGKSGGYTRVPTVVTLIRGDKNQLFNCLFTLECNIYLLLNTNQGTRESVILSFSPWNVDQSIYRYIYSFSSDRGRRESIRTSSPH